MKFIDYAMRGGEHPDLEREKIEKQVAETTLNLFMNDPKYQEKGIKWLYNLMFFQTIYCTRDNCLLSYLYQKRPYPEFFELEVTTLCDMKCKLCEHSYWDTPAKNMSFEDFKKIVGEFPNLKWAGMTGIGQSWLNKDYLKMMKYLKDKNVYIENFDNFKHITPEISKELIDMGLDKLYVSLDAATEETFNLVQKGANWDEVISNIKSFDAYKKSKNLHYPELWFHYIITKDNIDEMEDYLQMISDLGVDVECVQFTKLLHAFKEIEETQIEISDEKKEAVFDKAQELGIKVGFNMNTSNEEERAPIANCAVWTQPFIFVDGTVVACCSQNEQNDRPFQIKTSPGNILKDGMRKVWKEGYGKMLDTLDSGEIPENCKRCVLYRK